MNWIVYRMSPIDPGWEFLKTVVDTVGPLAATEAEEIARNGNAMMLETPLGSTFLEGWDTAKAAAYEHGWEGDFRQGPVVFWLPNDGGFTHGFVFKQDNNGTSFIVSPYALPWLRSAY